MFTEEVGSGQMLLTPWVSKFVEAAEFDQDSSGEVSAIRPDPDFPAVRLDPSLRGGSPSSTDAVCG